MVRLRVNIDQMQQLAWNEFQFQYGAIKRFLIIKRQRLFADFNSSMVRLREWGALVTAGSGKIFQFQYGAIKRIFDLANHFS